jgi:serine/threonine protein kinase, bacterial
MTSARSRIAAPAAVATLLVGGCVVACGNHGTGGTQQTHAVRNYTVGPDINIGKGDITSVVVDSAGHTLYVATNDGSVTVVDTTTNTATGTIPVAGAYALYVDGPSHVLYVGSRQKTPGQPGSVTMIDTNTRNAIATIAVGADPYDIEIDSATHTAYVSNETQGPPSTPGNTGYTQPGSVSVIDTAQHSVAVTVPVGYAPEPLALDASSHSLFIGTGALPSPDKPDYHPNIWVLDTTSMTTSTIPMSQAQGNFAFDKSTHSLYVALATDCATVSAVDTASKTVTATFPVPKSNCTMDFDSTTHRLVTSTLDPPGIAVIDPNTRSVATTVALPNANVAFPVVDSKTDTVYVIDKNTLHTITAS